MKDYQVTIMLIFALGYFSRLLEDIIKDLWNKRKARKREERIKAIE